MGMKEYIVHVDESTLEQDELEWFKEQGAKELVRCKDCVKRYTRFCPDVDSPTRADDWFCADGKR